MPENWKALILAAGFGARLRPYTGHTPKPLFTINRQPLLDIIIRKLILAGCGGITVNTHYLHEKIERFLAARSYDIPVRTRHEPEILGTGGAIKNNAALFGELPFLVINSDVYSDIDLAAVYNFHRTHDAPVTLVLCDDDNFNTVAVNSNGHIIDFYTKDAIPADTGDRLLTFTGIHVIDPEVPSVMPEAGTFSGIIDTYRDLLTAGQTIHAWQAEENNWHDIGTPERYRRTAFDVMARQAMSQVFNNPSATVSVNEISPDGSDNLWYRLTSAKNSLVACDRGIRAADAVCEADAFTHISEHLKQSGAPVPQVYLSDPFAGLAFMEDLGDVNLQQVAQKLKTPDDIMTCYQPVIDQLVAMAVNAARGFDPAWTYQTARYDRQVILENECRYFTNAFLKDYLGMADAWDTLSNEFEKLAGLTLETTTEGLMHRDMQSRNIMMPNNRPHFIDVQGARLGPIQYDLASLLIDPYTALADDMQEALFDYYVQRLAAYQTVDAKQFRVGYLCCRVTRNLQILGAFGFLTGHKNKPQFAQYIPRAIGNLRPNLDLLTHESGQRFPCLRDVAQTAADMVGIRQHHGTNQI